MTRGSVTGPRPPVPEVNLSPLFPVGAWHTLKQGAVHGGDLRWGQGHVTVGNKQILAG